MAITLLKLIRARVAKECNRWFLPEWWKPEDVEQEVHMKLTEQFGDSYGELIVKDETEVPEREEMLKEVEKTVNRIRSTPNKRRRRKLRDGSIRTLPDVTFPGFVDVVQGEEPVDLELTILELFTGLTDRQRAVIESKRLGFTHEEISERTGVPLATVNRVIDKFRKKLKHVLVGTGLNDEQH
jgi:DNA-directed RNA polymerase specialized sigma24 family protein